MTAKAKPQAEDIFAAILPFVSPMANHRDVKAAITKSLAQKADEPSIPEQ